MSLLCETFLVLFLGFNIVFSFNECSLQVLKEFIVFGNINIDVTK